MAASFLHSLKYVSRLKYLFLVKPVVRHERRSIVPSGKARWTRVGWGVGGGGACMTENRFHLIMGDAGMIYTMHSYSRFIYQKLRFLSLERAGDLDPPPPPPPPPKKKRKRFMGSEGGPLPSPVVVLTLHYRAPSINQRENTFIVQQR